MLRSMSLGGKNVHATEGRRVQRGDIQYLVNKRSTMKIEQDKFKRSAHIKEKNRHESRVSFVYIGIKGGVWVINGRCWSGGG